MESALCSVSLEPRNWLMVSNIPFGSEWKDYLKRHSSIFGWNFRKVTLPFASIRNFRNFLSNGKHPWMVVVLCWFWQFGSMPALEEAMTSWFHCSAKNTPKWEKIIAKNKGAFFKACSRSTRSISGTSELAVLKKKPFPCFLNVKSSFVPPYGS